MVDRCWHWPMVVHDFDWFWVFAGVWRQLAILPKVLPSHWKPKHAQTFLLWRWCRLKWFPNSCWLMPFLLLQDASKGFAQCLSSWNLVRQQLAGRARLGHLSWPIFDRGWAEWKAREHFPWHESPRSSQKSAQIKEEWRRSIANIRKYSFHIFTLHTYIHIIYIYTYTSHMSLTHPYHSLPISSRLYSPDSSGDLNSRTVLGPKGQVKDILQEVISDPHIQALGTWKNGVNLGLWPKFEPRIWEHLANLDCYCCFFSWWEV